MQPRASIVRVAAAFTAAAMVVSAGMASAAVKKKAPKPSCKIVAAKPGGVSDQSLDIVYGDVASDAKNLTAVIGVAKLIASGQDSDNRLGREWDISFTIDGKQVTLQSYDGALASSFTANGTLSFDTKNNQLRVTISLADLANKLNAPVRNKASVITNFVVNTATTIVGPAVPGALRAGTYYQTGQADRVLSSAKYVAGSPSCVKVGS